jgi:hypothetical protein
MPLCKANRHSALVGIAIVLFLWFTSAPSEVAITHQDSELFDGHDHKGARTQYRTVERVASDVYVSFERGLVPETKITSHIPGLSLQRLLQPESTDPFGQQASP